MAFNLYIIKNVTIHYFDTQKIYHWDLQEFSLFNNGEEKLLGNIFGRMQVFFFCRVRWVVVCWDAFELSKKYNGQI